MADKPYKRYRHGRVSRLKAPSGKIVEYRVGPVPPKSGINETTGKPISKNLQGANYQDILVALGKVKTPFTVPAIYHRRTSKTMGYRWTGSERREVSELINAVHYAIANKIAISDFARSVFALDYAPGQVLAWNFSEVY